MLTHRDASGVAQFSKPITEPGRGVGLAEMGNKERLNAHGRRRLNDLVQLGMHRDLIQPRLNSVEEWRFINHNNDEHPIHVHVNDFQVIEYFDPTTGLRTGPDNGTDDAW